MPYFKCYEQRVAACQSILLRTSDTLAARQVALTGFNTYINFITSHPLLTQSKPVVPARSTEATR
jgi:hypothetical protein